MESQHCHASGWACKEYIRNGQHDPSCAHCHHSEGCHKTAQQFAAIAEFRKMKQEMESKIPKYIVQPPPCKHEMILMNS